MTDWQRVLAWYRALKAEGRSVEVQAAKIRALHALCEAQADLIGALAEERQDVISELEDRLGPMLARR